ncbi:hypothetical protein PR202_ga10615 [Eleusine coracana subsp. coracana]|uniref:FBD domain-containing protein n=1 Tax=Eleusine coracana subsp. coracana TaxID=191504 RepID=A0AAV5C774_ELECO|nr:hypothetical protein PR202_ga10615 [Eleusine coracana subsp. coracana]
MAWTASAPSQTTSSATSSPRLPIRNGACTAALATCWRSLWSSIPLVLHDSDLLLASTFDDEVRAVAFAAVGCILADHPGPFRKDLVLLDVDDSTKDGVLQRLANDILRCASLQRLFLTYWQISFSGTTTDVTFPHLKKFGMQYSSMRDQDLDHILACSPVLQILTLSFSKYPQRIRLRSKSLQCMVLWMYMAEELAVVDVSCLKRLIMWITFSAVDDSLMIVKIHRAPELREFGYLEPRVHQLEIGNTVINATTKANPSSIVPSVKILALKVNFSAVNEVNMLPSFLRCIPNVETLHMESSVIGGVTASHHAMFWREVLPVECLKSHVKKIVMHKFRGHRSEFEFLKFIAKGARKLQNLLLVLTKEVPASVDQVAEVNRQLAIGT